MPGTGWPEPTPQERELLALTNRARAEHALGPLHWDPALAEAAQRHDRRMLGEPALSHRYPGEEELTERAARAGARFSIVAENLAVAPTPAGLLEAWMRSPAHRANLLDPRLDAIGLGVLSYGNELYATQDFAHAVAIATSEQAEAETAAQVKALGIGIRPDPDAIGNARASCAMDSGFHGDARPRFIMRWESSSLDRLPEPLTERIATGKYRSAAVGSCAADGPQAGFTSYRLAVLLF
jgi:hypothetical protein